MEMQAVSNGDYFSSLKEEYDIEFIKCRPLQIKAGEPAEIEYEDPTSGQVIKREFDYVILSEGIHPGNDADTIAELCGLGQDKNGFLEPGNRGVYVIGCAKRPEKIEEAWADAIATAGQIRSEI